jgi:hypothetical protein
MTWKPLLHKAFHPSRKHVETRQDVRRVGPKWDLEYRVLLPQERVYAVR